jgi:PAS domain S-box-containing protein
VGLVVGIAGIHDIIEAGGFLPHLGMLYFIPITLFFVPVVYAALSFGLAGSVPTALLVVVINIPNWLFWHHGLDRWGVMFQVLVVGSAGFFVGQWVDRERHARRQREAASEVLRLTETKYRGLFESSPIAVLLLDPEGGILEANPAAGLLFGEDPEALKTMVVADLLEGSGTQRLLHPSQGGRSHPDSRFFSPRDNPEVYLEPILTQINDSQGDVSIQVLLRDATEEQHRQAGLRAYAAHVTRAQEEERQRIARELHDETIQDLIVLCRQLDRVGDASPALPDSAIDSLRETRMMAEEIVEGLRNSIQALRPSILDDLGLVAALRRLLADLQRRGEVRVQLKVVGERHRLSPVIELGLFRIAQEALSNVERHSRATTVAMTVAFGEDEARLDVIDDGGGLAPPSSQVDAISNGQLGLIGMQERAELLGGSLEIHSTPGKGTQITASFPIGEEPSEGPESYQ